MKFLIKIVLIVMFLGGVLFSRDVANVTALNGEASLQRAGKITELNLGDKLQEKDTIITNAFAKVQIVFKDETIITIGKNSNFSISEYLFEDKKTPVAKFAMLKGAMRTITGRIGKIAPDKFSVTTKTATIGIRGTNFSVVIDEDGTHRVFCTYGAISVRVNGTEHIVEQGYYIIISPNGKIEIKPFSAKDLKQMKDKNFGKGESKKGSTNRDSSASADGQLDNTTDDEGDIVINDVSDFMKDAEQTNENNDPTPDSVIAGYTMDDADYDGSYSIESQTGTVSLIDGGFASLHVDFANDIYSLRLFDSLNNTGTVQITYNNLQSGANTNHFNLVSSGSLPSGAADGTFYGSTGNTVRGSYSYNYNADIATGKYTVTTQQVLH